MEPKKRACIVCARQLAEDINHFQAQRRTNAKGVLTTWFRRECRDCQNEARRRRYNGPLHNQLKAKVTASGRRRRVRPEVRLAERVEDRERKRALRSDPERRANDAAYVRAWRAAHPERYAAFKAYPGMNAGKRFHNAMRRARKMMATPPWVDLAAIKAFYVEARCRSLETGTSYVVDHIMPLKGVNFSGLNVPWNLQIITASENSSKCNRVLV